MRATLEIIGMIAVLFAGVFVYDRYFVDHEQPKPIITSDSTYYWISASQIDTLKELRARVDSFQTSAKVVLWREKTVWRHDTIPIKDDPSTGLLDLSLYNIYEIDTIHTRGKDSLQQRVGFTMYPEPHFMFIDAWNSDHVLVKDRVTTVVLPPKKKFITHGVSIGPVIGILNKKVDIGIGYTFTFNF